MSYKWEVNTNKIYGRYWTAPSTLKKSACWRVSVSEIAPPKFCIENTGDINATEYRARVSTWDEVEAYCTKMDQLYSASSAELPKPGDVWGVPGKPETWRKVIEADTNSVRYGCFSHGTYKHRMEDWSHFVTSSGAVRIDGGGQVVHWSLRDRAETAERRVKELEAEVAELLHQVGFKAERLAEARAANDKLWEEETCRAQTERDELRAAKERERLLEALRGIEGHNPCTCDHYNYEPCMDWMRTTACDAIKREEGVKS